MTTATQQTAAAANETKPKRPRRYCSHRDSKWNGINVRDGVDYCGTCGKPIRPEWQPSDAARTALAEILAHSRENVPANANETIGTAEVKVPEPGRCSSTRHAHLAGRCGAQLPE